MFNFMKKKTAVNGKDYKRMYLQKCEEYESLAKDYNVVVANLQDLVSVRKELLDELIYERNRHDKCSDYSEPHTPMPEEIESAFNEETV